MGKLKQPILSLGAHGSLGGVLTYQERHQQALVRTKPIPTQPNTWKQLRWRYLYQNYCDYWNTLSTVDKLALKSRAGRQHLTGIGLFFKENLGRTDDLVICFPFDEGSGAIAYDYSGNDNHANIIGCLHADGQVGKCLSFDGVDDIVTAPAQASQDRPAVTGEITIGLWVYVLSLSPPGSLYGSFVYKDYTFSYALYWRGRKVLAYIQNAHLYSSLIPLNSWHYILFEAKSGDYMRFRIDDSPDTERTVGVGTMQAQPTKDLLIGHANPVYGTIEGKLDEIRIYDHFLTSTEKTQHYERRHP